MRSGHEHQSSDPELATFGVRFNPELICFNKVRYKEIKRRARTLLFVWRCGGRVTYKWRRDAAIVCVTERDGKIKTFRPGCCDVFDCDHMVTYPLPKPYHNQTNDRLENGQNDRLIKIWSAQYKVIIGENSEVKAPISKSFVIV